MFEGTCGVTWTFQNLRNPITPPASDSIFLALSRDLGNNTGISCLVSVLFLVFACLFFCLFSCAHQRVLKEGSLCGEVCVYWLLQTRMSVIALHRDVVGKYE